MISKYCIFHLGKAPETEPSEHSLTSQLGWNSSPPPCSHSRPPSSASFVSYSVAESPSTKVGQTRNPGPVLDASLIRQIQPPSSVKGTLQCSLNWFVLSIPAMEFPDEMTTVPHLGHRHVSLCLLPVPLTPSVCWNQTEPDYGARWSGSSVGHQFIGQPEITFKQIEYVGPANSGFCAQLTLLTKQKMVPSDPRRFTVPKRADPTLHSIPDSQSVICLVKGRPPHQPEASRMASI